jgi:hypothetical protein
VAIVGRGVSARAPRPARDFRLGEEKREGLNAEASLIGTRYNSPQPMATSQRVFYAVFFMCLAAVSGFGADKWDAPAAETSRRIISLAGNGPLSFEVRNASSIPQDQATTIRRAIESNLRAQGVTLREAAQGFATVRVTLSENIQGWIWIIEMPGAPDAKISILSFPKESGNPGLTSGNMSLRKTILFAQNEQILDAASLSKNGEQVVVVSPSSISVYRTDASTRTWNLEQSWSIPHVTYPRDLRGRLQMNSDGEFTAYLPGIRCHGKALQQESAQCMNTDDPWWLAGASNAFFNSARNYFTGVVPGLPKTFPPFYSAALLKRKTDTWLVSTIDGQVNLLDGTQLKAVTGTRDWGSDIAAVHSNCGAGGQLLATGSGDNSNGDTIRAFEIPDTEAVMVSSPLVFEGTITALWTGTGGDAATAVVRTPTGNYEAYSISISCNQ